LYWLFEGTQKRKPEEATSGFEGELRKQSEAQQGNLYLPWLLTVCKGWRPFFVFGGGVLPLVWCEVLRMSAMLEGTGLLF
jgi:hypothetical protein